MPLPSPGLGRSKTSGEPGTPFSVLSALPARPGSGLPSSAPGGPSSATAPAAHPGPATTPPGALHQRVQSGCCLSRARAAKEPVLFTNKYSCLGRQWFTLGLTWERGQPEIFLVLELVQELLQAGLGLGLVGVRLHWARGPPARLHVRLCTHRCLVPLGLTSTLLHLGEAELFPGAPIHPGPCCKVQVQVRLQLSVLNSSWKANSSSLCHLLLSLRRHGDAWGALLPPPPGVQPMGHSSSRSAFPLGL